MKSLSLILRIVAIIAACGAAALFFMAQGKIKEKDADLQAATTAHETTKAELADANAEVAKLNTSIVQERNALAENKRKLETVRSEMYTAQQEVTRSQSQLQKVQQQFSNLKVDLESTRSKLVAAEREAAEASKAGELAALNERVKELEIANKDLEDDLNVAKSKADAMTAARQSAADTSATGGYSIPTGGPAVAPATIGQEVTIASVSSDDGILVFDQGASLGLTPGTQVTLIKDMKAIGKVQVSQVKKTYTVANILPGTSARSLSTGMAVKILY